MGWTRFNDVEEERIDRDLVRYRVVLKRLKGSKVSQSEERETALSGEGVYGLRWIMDHGCDNVSHKFPSVSVPLSTTVL